MTGEGDVGGTTEPMGVTLVLHPSDELYGADRVLLEVVDVLREHGPVEVWLPDDVDYGARPLTARLRSRGVVVRRAPLPVLRRAYRTPLGVARLALRWLRTGALLWRRRPRRVYLNTSAVLPAAPWARLRGAEVILHLHEIWRRGDAVVLGPLLRACHRVLAVSEATAAALPRAPRGLVVVHNGFEVPGHGAGHRAEGGATAEELRDRARATPDDVLVVVASRWNLWKGHDVLLEAWGLTERPDLRLAVLGGPPVAGVGVDVEAAVAALQEPGTVTVVGETDDVAGWVAAADVVAVPSTLPDPFPTIAVEAHAAGRAVLAARTGGLPEIVDDGVTGRLVDPGDRRGWAAALDALDRDELAVQGRAARERYEQRWTVAAFRERLVTALGGTPPRAPDATPSVARESGR